MATQVKISSAGFLFNGKIYNKGIFTVMVNNFLESCVEQAFVEFRTRDERRIVKLSADRRYSIAYQIFTKKIGETVVPDHKLAEYRAKLRSKVKEHIFQSTLAGLETLGQ